MQPRDLEILSAVLKYRVVTSGHLRALLFAGRSLRVRLVMVGSLGSTRSQFSCQPMTANTEDEASRSIQPRSRPWTQNSR